MRKLPLRLVILALIVAAGLALRAKFFTPGPMHVQVATVERGTVEATVANTKAGTVRARLRAKLSPGMSGLVTELQVKRGDHVEKGALLLRLDDAEPGARLALARRELEVATARHARTCLIAHRAQTLLDRNRELAEENIVSQDRIDELESAFQTASADCTVAAAEVEQARAQIGIAQVAFDKTRLTAPFEGIVAEVNIEVGEWVTPSVPLVIAPDTIDMLDPSSLYISAPIDEIEAGRLQIGQVTRVTIDSRPGETFAGKVVAIAPYVLDVEQQNRTVEIEVELSDRELSRGLLPGTSADVEVVLQVKQDVLRIPTYGVLDGHRALVVNRDGKIEEREIELGLRNWEYVEITAGLALDEEVVVRFEGDDLPAGTSVVVDEP